MFADVSPLPSAKRLTNFALLTSLVWYRKLPFQEYHIASSIRAGQLIFNLFLFARQDMKTQS